jgi:putative membrane protein
MTRLDLSVEDRGRVTRAITHAERDTSGEIVVVVTRQSDDYIHVPLHIAAAVALAMPLLLPWISRLFPWAAVSFSWIYMIQLLSFIVVALVLSIGPLRYLVTPRALMRKYGHRNAASQFLTRNMHTTRGRTGVLIFVSLLERFCEVVGDTEIAAKVSPATWQSIVDEMLPILHDERIGDGLVLGVRRCGEVLAQHFPPGTENSNELPNHLIVID